MLQALQQVWCCDILRALMGQNNPVLEAGVDEAGRGPLAGPVVVAAVILPANYELPSLDDSKRLSAKRRRQLAPEIANQAIAYAVEFVEVDEIDRVNILQATLNGMRRAVEQLKPKPERAIIDGNRAPRLSCEVRTVVGGDRTIASISAASVLAKVSRDRLMISMHQVYPGYGFDRHKGYPTAHHLDRLRVLGPCPIHRTSFAPVRRLIDQTQRPGSCR